MDRLFVSWHATAEIEGRTHATFGGERAANRRANRHQLGGVTMEDGRTLIAYCTCHVLPKALQSPLPQEGDFHQ